MKLLTATISLCLLLLAASSTRVAGQDFYLSNTIDIDTNTASTFKTAFHMLAHHDSIGDEKASIQDLIRISWMFTSLVRIDRSMEFLEIAKSRCEKIKDSSSLAHVLTLLANNYKSIGAYPTAIKFFESADSIYIGSADPKNHIFTQFCLSYVLQNEYEGTRNKEKIDQALNIIQELWPFADNVNDVHKPIITLIAAKVLNSKGESMGDSKGRIYYEDALKLARKGKAESDPDAPNSLYTYFMINEAEALIGLDSLKTAQTTISGIKEEKLDDSQLTLFFPMAKKFYKSKGNYAKALEYVEKNNILIYRNFNPEIANKSQKYSALVAFEEIMRNHDQRQKLMEEEYEARKKHTDKINHILKVNLIIFFAIVVLLIMDSIYLRRSNSKLNETKAEIEKQNSKLMVIQDTIKKQTEEIKVQCQTLNAQAKVSNIFKNRMRLAISLAKPIQDALMATPEIQKECLSTYFIYSKSLAPVSGDFYWMRKAGKFTYLMVADATGHGVPGALLSMLGISIMNDIASVLNLTSPQTSTGSILDLLKERFLSVLGHGNGQIQDSIDLALIKIDKEQSQLQYSGANRPLVLVRDMDVMEFKPTRMCIGPNVLDRGNFASNIIDYEPNDMIYLFSDGYTDQFGGTDGHTKFGTKRLYELLSSISYLPVETQRQVISGVMDEWINTDTYNAKADQIDDEIIFGIRM